MTPLDHKNLDKDVPYFANIVRWLSYFKLLSTTVLQCLSCDYLFLLLSSSAQLKTWLFTFGTT